MYHQQGMTVHTPEDLGLSWSDIGGALKKVGSGAKGVYDEYSSSKTRAQILDEQNKLRMQAEAARRMRGGGFMDKYGTMLVLAAGGVAIYFLVIKKKK